MGAVMKHLIHAMRNLHMTLVVFLLLVQGVHSQRVKLNRGKPSSRTYHSTVKYRDIRGKIIIPVEIEGQTYQFLFDTGAPNLISRDLSDRISSRTWRYT